MELDLKDNTVLITGSSRGIGGGIAESFIEENARVIITGRDQDELNNTVIRFREQYDSNKVLYFIGDLQLEENLNALAKYILNNSDGLNHLVCNIGSGQSVPPLEEDILEFQRMLDINLMNAVGVVKQMLPLLEHSAQKGDSTTSITFIGSICGMESLGCPVAYSSAKSALLSYSKNISRPLGKKGIRVNVVSPGNILFSGSTWESKLEENPDGINAMLNKEVPLQRFGDVCDVANAVLFLASKRASFVTGVNWVVDGGQTSAI